MKIINEMKLVLPGYSINEAFARVAVSTFFAQLNPTVEEISDIKTAISEAVTNCIVHAYKEKIQDIYVVARVLENNIAYIKIRDKGCGIANIEQAMEPLFTTSSNEERAGLGFVVMQSFMDSVKVSSTVDKGTTVIMQKKILSRK